LRFALAETLESVSLFKQRDANGLSPLVILFRRVQEVLGTDACSPPAVPPPPESHVPPWIRLAQHAPQRVGEERVPFGDLLLEVEDPSREGGVARIAAHRVVLSAGSDVLRRELRQLSPGVPLRVDAQSCCSGNVLLAAVRFMYGDVKACCLISDAFLLWQLLCLCTQYAFPATLAEYARAALLHSLRLLEHAPLMGMLLQAADKVNLAPAERVFVAAMLVADPAALESAAAASAKIAAAGAGDFAIADDSATIGHQAALLSRAFTELELGVVSGPMPGVAVAPPEPLMLRTPSTAPTATPRGVEQGQALRSTLPARRLVPAAAPPREGPLTHRLVA